MKTTVFSPLKSQKGYALLMVCFFFGISLLLVGGALQWSAANTRLNDRNNVYFATVAAAEGASEKVLTRIARDHFREGEPGVRSRISSYENLVPNGAEDPGWDQFRFSNTEGLEGQTKVIRNGNPVFTNTPQGMGWVTPYEIRAQAQNARYGIEAAISKSVNVETTPLFQYALFWDMDMELEPGANMTVNGAVHCNQNIYFYPGAGTTLQLNGETTAAGNLNTNRIAGDPRSPASMGTLRSPSEPKSGVLPVILPLGDEDLNISNVINVAEALLDPPPAGEDPNSPEGRLRQYNQADLLVLVSNNTVLVKSGLGATNVTVIIPTNQVNLFVATNALYNEREGLPVQAVQINVGALRKWSATNTVLGPINSIYVNDERSTRLAVISTNYFYSTNYTYTTNLAAASSTNAPDPGTYFGNLTNVMIAGFVMSAPPYTKPASPATSVVTNTVSRTGPYPSPGTYVGSVITNTVPETSASRPSSGYLGVIVTNCNGSLQSSATDPGTAYCWSGGKTTTGTGSSKRWKYYTIKDYTYTRITSYNYNLISSFNYSLPGYSYAVSANVVTNSVRSTNTYYTTNLVQVAEAGVILTNGATLPAGGLTVATPDPLYVQGDYNVSRDGTTFTRGSSDTANTLPASLMGDAITVLSTTWTNSPTSTPLANRTAGNTTVNAAFLSGIVPTDSSSYSGGVENFPRFLESWSGKTLTYNGSMVSLFASRYATGDWRGTGSAINIYNAPVRNWAFDMNFLTEAGMPPNTPRARQVQRVRMQILEVTSRLGPVD